MKVEVDQSGKVEQTNFDTIVALSNERNISIRLTKQSKRELLIYFRERRKEFLFPYVTFSILVALVIKSYKPTHTVTIDTEYMGHEALIKKCILLCLKHWKITTKTPIEFGFVGKSSPAHEVAAKVMNKKISPSFVVSIRDIVQIVVDTKIDREVRI
jgi:hypothetical protein